MRLHPLLLLLGTLLHATAAGASGSTAVAWRTDSDRALRAAARGGQAVLLNVGASWCEECERLDTTTLVDLAVVEALEPLVTIKVDGDLDPELAGRYRVSGYPTLIVLDPDGRERARSRGAVSPAVLLGWLDAAGATCRVQGFVRDTDRRPVKVRLTVLPGGKDLVTRADGFFCLPEAAPGPVELLVQHDGAGNRSVVMVGEGPGPVRHDIDLTHDRHETVVVTATRTAKLLRDVAVRTEVVTRERIEQSASRTLAEAVEYTPGVRVESNCQNCNFSQVRMLGLEGAYSQILIDGQAQWSPLSMVYGIEQIPTRLIERLEVVKGGGSTTYGPGAVGGVINVIPRRPGRAGGVVELRGDAYDGDNGHTINGAYDWVSTDNRSFFTAYGQEDEVPGLDLSGDGFTEIAARELTTVGLRGEHAMLDGKGRLTADFSYYDAFRRGGDRVDLPPEQTELAEQIDTQRRSVSLRWSHDTGEADSYHVATTYVTTERDTYYGGGQDPNAFGASDNPLFLLEAQVNRVHGGHTVSWGTQFQRDGIDDRQPSIDRALDLTYTNTGVFVQDDWTLGENRSLLFGIRADKHSEIDDPIVSPRAAFRWSPNKELTLRSAVSTGFRPPAVFDEDLHIELAGGSRRQVVLAPDLTEERSASFMQGIEWLPRRGESFWLVEANLFYTGIDDIFEEEEIAPNLFEKRNGGSADVHGVEIGLGYDLPRLFTVELGWVSQRARFDRPEADFGSRDFFRTPEQSGVVNFTLRNGKLGEAFVALRYTGSMLVPRYFFDDVGEATGSELVESESFVTVDASVSRRFDVGSRGSKLRLQLGARNLTDEFQGEIDNGPFRDANFVYGPRYPRSLYFTSALVF